MRTQDRHNRGSQQTHNLTMNITKRIDDVQCRRSETSSAAFHATARRVHSVVVLCACACVRACVCVCVQLSHHHHHHVDPLRVLEICTNTSPTATISNPSSSSIVNQIGTNSITRSSFGVVVEKQQPTFFSVRFLSQPRQKGRWMTLRKS